MSETTEALNQAHGRGDDDTEAAKSTRPRKIGGTDIGAIVGVSSYRAPIDVYQRIVEGRREPQTPVMRRGLRLEPVIRDWYVEETGARLAPHPGIVQSARYDFATASPDDLLADRDAGAEYKSASFRMAAQYGEAGTDEVPQHYAVQVAWYMAVLDRSEWDLAVLLGGDELRVYRMTRDLELESMLVEAAARFWRDHIVARRPPPPDATERYAEYLARRHSTSNGRMLELTPELAALVQDFAATKATRELVEKEEREKRNRLEAALGDFDGIYGACTHRLTEGRANVNYKAVCAEAGVPAALVEKHTTRSPYRILRLTTKGKKS